MKKTMNIDGVEYEQIKKSETEWNGRKVEQMEWVPIEKSWNPQDHMESAEDFQNEGLEPHAEVHHHAKTDFAISHHPDRKGDKKYYLHGDGGQMGGYEHKISAHKTFDEAKKAHNKYHKKINKN